MSKPPIDIRPVICDPVTVNAYARLLAEVFHNPKKFTPEYIYWLYCKNPKGHPVGFDAWAGQRLVAHYVCIPISVALGGEYIEALLSLNTATAPDYRGQGLFAQLAELTYQEGQKRGFRLVVGVANAQSTPGFLKKLGFTLIAPLEALVGIGKQRFLDVTQTFFHIHWEQDTLLWRLQNPVNPVTSTTSNGVSAFFARTQIPELFVWCQMKLPWFPSGDAQRLPLLRLFIGLTPEKKSLSWSAAIPRALRPSPLNLILRPLSSAIRLPAKDSVFFSFLDFDAY